MWCGTFYEVAHHILQKRLHQKVLSMQYQNQDLAPLLNQIVSAGFVVDNLFQNAQRFWQANLSPDYQPVGRVVSSEWGRGATPLEALERAYKEALRVYGVRTRRKEVSAKPYIDPLS